MHVIKKGDDSNIISLFYESIFESFTFSGAYVHIQ